MKIGFFGNTNNYPLRLAQAVRKLGHEVVLVVDNDAPLNQPENRHSEFEASYPDWIIDGSCFSEQDYIAFNPKIAPLLDVLSSCDALILNSLGPSLLPLLRRPAIAFLTGSDLSYYADFATVEARTTTWDPSYKMSPNGQFNINLLRDFIQKQRDGIQMSVAVSYMPRGLVPASDALLDNIGVSDSKRFFIYMAELEQVKSTSAPHNQPVRIFCATRLTWKTPIEPGRSALDDKGSDIMIKGLGLFYRQTGTPLDIQLVRKGLHVTELEQLIAEEGLIDQVTWSDEMPLTAVWQEFARCDIVFEQLADSMIGMAGLDALAIGRPVIGNARPEIVGQGLPICQANTAEEVCDQLKRLVFNPAEREKVGLTGRQYVEEYCSPKRSAQDCLQYLQEALRHETEDTVLEKGIKYSYFLQKRYEDMQQVVQTTQAELQSVQAQLQSTQTQLQSTQAELQSAQAELARSNLSWLAQLARKLRGRLRKNHVRDLWRSLS